MQLDGVGWDGLRRGMRMVEVGMMSMAVELDMAMLYTILS